jgi:predicted RNA-binding protein with PUA-like domain
MAKKSPSPFISTGFWLMKSEPESYSIDAFKKDGKTLWTGVRNYQARNYMMTSMKSGDRFLFYHSSSDPSAVVGTGHIVKANVPDPSALDKKNPNHYDPKSTKDHPIWLCAEVAYDGHLKKILPLEELKKQKVLAKMVLLQRGSRLSIQPVTEAEYKAILQLAGGLK